MLFQKITKRACFAALLLLMSTAVLRAQTDEDAIMMTKNNFCVGGTYSYSSWDHYWEGNRWR